MFADIVVFDPGKVIDRATFEMPNQYPVGIEYVIVNGKISVDKGQRTAALAGRVLAWSRLQALIIDLLEPRHRSCDTDLL